MRAASGREVVIVEAARTPVGRGRKDGYYADTHANELLGAVYAALIERTGIEPKWVESVIAGCVDKLGEQAANPARNAWLQAGLPVETSASTIDIQCGSSQHAVGLAAALIAAGVHDVMIAAGVEHMGHVPILSDQVAEFGSPWPPALYERYDLVSQGVSAEMIAQRWELTRAELDQLGLRSHLRAAAATDDGRFDREIVPFRTDGTVRTTDEGIRRDTSLERLATLKPAFEEGGRVTAGNSSQISDGAAGVMLMTREKAEELGLRPRARIVDQTTVGVDPVIMLTGPIPATRALLERNDLDISRIDLFEVNEAFASVVLAWQRELQADPDRVNVNGGAMAIGHPLGASGARLMTTLLHELEQREGRLGLVTMCCGGGVGTGTLIERLG